MVTLSAFADEISPKLEDQAAVLKACGLTRLDLRGFDNTNVMKLSDEQVKHAVGFFRKEGLSVACIGSPIGKAQITDVFDLQIGQMRRALELAKTFGAKAIRVFSFYLPKGDDPKKWRKDVLSRMEQLAKMAQGSGATVVLENEEGLYGDTIDRCVDVIEHVKAPHLKLAFDPCNLVIIGPRPFTDSFAQARKHLGYVHVKDWVRARKEMVPAGQGDAEWPAILKGLVDAKYDGVVALEPHLSAAGQFSGFSGPDLFRKAHAGLTEQLKAVGLDWK